MEWSREVPQEDGWYWVMGMPEEPRPIMALRESEGEWVMAGDEQAWYDEDFGDWLWFYGPIEPPPPVEGVRSV